MKLFRLSILFIILGTLSAGLYAGGFALSGVGSRATAMGGAFRGLSDDPTAMYWNPAGLAFQDGNSVALGGTFIMPSSKWENPNHASTASLRPGETESEPSFKAFPNAFLTMAKHPKLKYGLGVFVPYGLGSTWDLYETAPIPAWADFPENEMSSSIAVFDIHPSVAYQIMPNFSAGVGISLMYGTIDLAKMGASTIATYNLNTTSISGSGFGFGANMGLMFKPTPCMTLGLTAKIPANINMSGDTESDDWSATAATINNTWDTETTLKLPMEIGFGVSSTRIKNLTLNLDYAYTMWDRLDMVTLDLTVPGVGVVQSDLLFNWENTSRVSLGAEYKLGCNDLRMGFYWDQSPIPESTQTPTLSDVGDKISTNIGWGRVFGKIGVDANFQYVMFGERVVDDLNIVGTAPTNVLGTYNAQSISGNIGISYPF
jgi:long-chain fatty acid transport protein